MSFRLNIDTEYQGWILMFATLTAVWVYCLPCYCAGLQMECCRKFATKIQQRLPQFLLLATGFNAVMMFLVVKWLPDWEITDYIKACLGAALFLAKNAAKMMVSIAFIVVFVFMLCFKENILKLLGMETKTFFRFKLRDMFSGASQKAIEIKIHEIKDLQAASLLAPNNVFVEVSLGYNETMKTRVHNNAGSNVKMNETIQLNFDPEEEEDPLFIAVKHQKVLGAGDLGRLEMKNTDLTKILEDCRQSHDTPVEVKLLPRGTLLFSIVEVKEDQAHTC